MAIPDFEWDVTRTGRTVRIDVTQATHVRASDTEAVVAATEALIADDDVDLLQLDGPAMHGQPPLDGLSGTIRALERLAESYGKRLIVSPI